MQNSTITDKPKISFMPLSQVMLTSDNGCCDSCRVLLLEIEEIGTYERKWGPKNEKGPHRDLGGHSEIMQVG